MKLIGQGEFGQVYRIEAGKVVKLFRSENFDERDFENEYRLTKYLGQVTDYTPKVYEKVQIDERHGYVMEEIPGPLFFDVIEANGDQLNHYATILGQAHYKLHERPVTQALDDVPLYKSFMERFLKLNKVFESDVNQWLLGLLKDLQGPNALLHSDFMPNNIIYDQGELKVIDWAEPSLGPAVADVARTLNMIKDHTDFVDSEMTKRSDEFLKSYLDGYLQSGSLDFKALNKAFILNAASDVAWAEHSGQKDEYSDYLRSFIMANYESDQEIYADFLKDYIGD